LATADLAGAALISRAEVSVAICKAVRIGIVRCDQGPAAVKQLREEQQSAGRQEEGAIEDAIIGIRI
jgi:hypothetical protein